MINMSNIVEFGEEAKNEALSGIISMIGIVNRVNRPMAIHEWKYEFDLWERITYDKNCGGWVKAA